MAGSLLQAEVGAYRMGFHLRESGSGAVSWGQWVTGIWGQISRSSGDVRSSPWAGVVAGTGDKGLGSQLPSQTRGPDPQGRIISKDTDLKGVPK